MTRETFVTPELEAAAAGYDAVLERVWERMHREIHAAMARFQLAGFSPRIRWEGSVAIVEAHPDEGKPRWQRRYRIGALN